MAAKKTAKSKETYLAAGSGRRFQKVSESDGIATLEQVGAAEFGATHGPVQVPVEQLDVSPDWRRL